MIVCANCGKSNEPDALYCTQCGNALFGNQPVTKVQPSEVPVETSDFDKNDLVPPRSLTDLFPSDFAQTAPPIPREKTPLPELPGKGETKPESMFPPPLKTDTFATLHMDASQIKDIFCDVCKTELRTPEDKFCWNCGAAQGKAIEKCRSCKTILMPDAKFCYHCGTPVLTIPQVTLHMANNDLTFKIPPRAEVFTIGRNVPQQNNFVDLDLGPYGQRRVSRQHARFILRDNQWYLEDLNSKAGTRIFNDRLAPFTPMPIENETIIYFAELKFKVAISV